MSLALPVCFPLCPCRSMIPAAHGKDELQCCAACPSAPVPPPVSLKPRCVAALRIVFHAAASLHLPVAGMSCYAAPCVPAAALSQVPLQELSCHAVLSDPWPLPDTSAHFPDTLLCGCAAPCVPAAASSQEALWPTASTTFGCWTSAAGHGASRKLQGPRLHPVLAMGVCWWGTCGISWVGATTSRVSAGAWHELCGLFGNMHWW